MPEILRESIPDNIEDYDHAAGEVDRLMEILQARKLSYQQRQPHIISLVSAAELNQFLQLGFVGAHNPHGIDMARRRAVARVEIENMVQLLRHQPIGVQLGVVVDSMPGASLQIFKQAERLSVAVSPYRLGTFANIRLGVATISAAPDATELYRSVTSQLWARSLKGEEGAAFIEKEVLGAAE